MMLDRWTNVVALALSFAAVAGAVEIAAQDEQTVWSGVYSEAQATRGKAAFSENCATCHMDDLSGDPDMTKSPALVGDAFVAKWDNKTLGELFTLIKTKMPDNQPGSLTDDIYRDSLAFVLQANKFPSGSEELKADDDALKNVKILKTKP